MADPRRSRGGSAVVETYNRGRQPSAVAVLGSPRNRSLERLYEALEGPV